MYKKAICGIYSALFVFASLPMAADEFSIAESRASEGAPSVVYNANFREYAVAYSRIPQPQDTTGKISLYLRAIPRDGANSSRVIPFFSEVHPSSPFSYRGDFPNVTVSWNPIWGVYLVTWDWGFFADKEKTKWKTKTYSQRLSFYGSIGKAYTVANGGYNVRSHHAYNPVEDDYLLLYCDWEKFDLLSVHLGRNGGDRLNSANKIGQCNL